MTGLKNKFRLLSKRDFERLVTLSERIHDADTNEPFLNHLYSVLKEAIPNKFFSIDSYSLNPICLKSFTSQSFSDEQLAIYQRYMKQHPLLKQLLSVGKTGVCTILAETAPEKFHETDLYLKFYKKIGVEDQLIFRLFHKNGAYVIAYSRDTAFSEKERVFMELLKPQVAIALKNWRRIRDLEKELRTLKEPTTEPERPVEIEPDEIDLLKSLTPRQRDVAELIAQGFGNREIAEVLQIAPKTVGKHIENIFEALNIHHRSALAVMWYQAKANPTVYGEETEV